MHYYLIPLILGFVTNLASAFTTYYSKKLGKRKGTAITFLLRNILGIPVWATGCLLAARETAGLLFQTSLFSQITGWSLISLGGITIIIALGTIRLKAAAPATDDNLIRTGIYARVRHPIHSGMVLEFTGIFFVWPTIHVCIASCIGLLWIYLQSWFEEKDLMMRIPEYTEYMKDVPRFLPRLFRLT